MTSQGCDIPQTVLREEGGHKPAGFDHIKLLGSFHPLFFPNLRVAHKSCPQQEEQGFRNNWGVENTPLLEGALLWPELGS